MKKLRKIWRKCWGECKTPSNRYLGLVGGEKLKNNLIYSLVFTNL